MTCQINKFAWAIVLLLLPSLAVRAQTNGGFEEGLSGWEPAMQTSAVNIVNGIGYKESACVRLGPDPAEISQRISLAPLCLFFYNTQLKSSDTATAAYSFVRFYDKSDRLLLEYKSKPVSSLIYQASGYYTESPALTCYAVIGAEKDQGSGYVYADDFTLKTRFGEPENKPAALVNLDQYMRPFWKGDTIYNETVLLYSVNGQEASGSLLFQPDKILSVRSFDLQMSFMEGKDYKLKGNVLTRISGSPIPYRTDSSFSHKDMVWFNLQSQWVVVTYLHHDSWKGLTPAFHGSQLPFTFTKLKAKLPLTIVAYGMSITRGMDVSGYDGKAPYMPAYVDLFARALRQKYKDSIQLYNAGLPGAKIDWGAAYADEYVNVLHPDLVIVDFGMNDFTQFTPDQFRGYAQIIITKLRSANPKVEIMLLSNMQFDPEYLAADHPQRTVLLERMAGFNKALQSLEEPGIVDLDMTTISELLYQKKKPKDFISNPLHPNDFMARWYAQGMAALLIRQ